MNPLTVNFTEGTSKKLIYKNSEEFKKFLMNAIKVVKRLDRAEGLDSAELHKRGRQAQA